VDEKQAHKELFKTMLYDEYHAEANTKLDNAIRLKRATSDDLEERKQRALKRRDRKKIFARLAIPVAVIFAIAAGLVAYDYAMSWGRIHPNVVVSGMEVGGMRPADAEDYLAEKLDELSQNPVTISNATEVENDEDSDSENAEENQTEPESWEIFAADIGLSFETTTAVAQAYEFGRGLNVLDALQKRLMSYFDLYHVDLTTAFDEEAAVETFEPLRSAINIAPSDSRVVLADGEFNIESGSDGIALNEVELAVLMASAILAQEFDIDAPVEEDPRDIDDASAEYAAHAANQAASLPVEVNYTDRSWTFEGNDIAALINFKRSDALEDEDAILRSSEPTSTTDIWLAPIINAEEVQDRIVGYMGADVGRAPVNARFSVSNGRVNIRPSEIGSGVDVQQLALDLAQVLADTDSEGRTTTLTMNELEPSLTTEDAEAMNIRERISTFTIPFSAGQPNRTHNIELISSKINYTIVAPGEEFSFNGTAGHANAARGFLDAGVIISGELSTAVGGGICQVSSTLFNTAMLAGVEITQRQNHSLFFSQYPVGRDAAVSWGTLDFRFRNTLNNYILVVAFVEDSASTVEFFGTDPDYDITIEAGEFERTSYGTNEVEDDTLPEGTRVVETRGVRGGTVDVVYTVRQGDTLVRQQTFRSTHRSANEVVRIGTMEPDEDEDDD